MKTYRITGNLKVRGVGAHTTAPFHLGASDEMSSYVDRVVFRDVKGNPLLPGTSLCGVMAGLARASLRAAGYTNPERCPAYVGLFGAARGDTDGQASRLIVHDSRLSDLGSSATAVRDRTGINRKRESAEDKRLFHEEVVDGAWVFPIEMEFAETGPRTAKETTLKERGNDPDTLALRLLLDVLSLLEAGWANIGANGSIGYGRCKLERCQITERDRCSPEQVRAFACGHWGAKNASGASAFTSENLPEVLNARAPIPVASSPACRPVEKIRFYCVLRPLEPLLVKTGYSAEVHSNRGSKKREQEQLNLSWQPEPREFPVDAGFCLNSKGLAYVPGSSIRGAVRSHVERIVRTITQDDDSAWDLGRADEKGREFSEKKEYDENDVGCLVSRVFGFSALGGRIRFSDAVSLNPEKFETRRKLLDHVALDRFTGGAAPQRKFNSRPYFPPHPNNLSNDGDLECEIELVDFDRWHLGMLLLLLRDLRLGRIIIGHGKNKGFGRVRLESVKLDALAAKGGILHSVMPSNSPSIGGFQTFSVKLGFTPEDYLCCNEQERLNQTFREAEREMRDQIANWSQTKVQGENL